MNERELERIEVNFTGEKGWKSRDWEWGQGRCGFCGGFARVLGDEDVGRSLGIFIKIVMCLFYLAVVVKT